MYGALKVIVLAFLLVLIVVSFPELFKTKDRYERIGYFVLLVSSIGAVYFMYH